MNTTSSSAGSLDGQLALVTGANRGIGLEVCRQLAARGARVLLASRDARKGERAQRALGGAGQSVRVVPLDVADAASIAALARRIAGDFGALDILVNNAGISMSGFDAKLADATLATNYFGAAAVTDVLAPSMPGNGRVVMVSSGMGQLSAFGKPMRERLLDPGLGRSALDALMRSFIDHVRAGTHAQHGWPSSAYRVSKAGLNALTRVLARDDAYARLRINAVSPGWARTDMGGRSAPRSVEVGAASVVWAATLPPNGPTGGYFEDGRRLEW